MSNIEQVEPKKTRRKRCRHCKGPEHYGVCIYPTDFFKGVPLQTKEIQRHIDKNSPFQSKGEE